MSTNTIQMLKSTNETCINNVQPTTLGPVSKKCLLGINKNKSDQMNESLQLYITSTQQ